MIVSDVLEDFLRWLDDAETNLRINEANEKLADEETQDILHRLELCEDPYLIRKKLSDAIPGIRQSRRVAKDNAELLSPVVQWKEDNPRTLSGLRQLLGELRKIERKQANRAYADRTDIVRQLLSE